MYVVLEHHQRCCRLLPLQSLLPLDFQASIHSCMRNNFVSHSLFLSLSLCLSVCLCLCTYVVMLSIEMFSLGL